MYMLHTMYTNVYKSCKKNMNHVTLILCQTFVIKKMTSQNFKKLEGSGYCG